MVFSITIVRYNIINSIHNFINNNTQNQYDYYILLLVIFLLILFLKKIFSKKDLNIVIFFKKTIILIIVLVAFIAITLYNYNNVRFMIILCLLFFLLFMNKKQKTTTTLLLIQKNSFFVLFSLIFLKNLLKQKLKNKTEHFCVLMFFCMLNQQNLIFNLCCLNDFITNEIQIKTNSVLDIYFYKIQHPIKLKIFLLDNFNLDFLIHNVFEKNIISLNFLEFYNFNKQCLIQLGFNLCFYLFFFFVLKTTTKKFYFLNKEHCLHINI